MNNHITLCQRDQGAENSPKPLMGLQFSEKILDMQLGFSWLQNKYVYLFRENGHNIKRVFVYYVHGQNLNNTIL